ncbi:MAG: class A beta-lactamase-related serine hydrolase [Xanthomonadales bacterium]|nr:class A beta-lactamase-related serine hydrolase [Xanthomonadales bacterium]
MNKSFRLLALATLFAITCPCAALAQTQLQTETKPGQQPAETPNAVAPEVAPPADALPGLEAFVDGIVEGAMAEHTALPGIMVSVVKDGQVVLLKGYGFADVDKKIPVDPATSMFRIGSITKTFTGLAVMQLVEQGKLDLDADVNTYLTAFKIPDTFPQPITLGALISHRAGFEDGALGFLFQQDPEKLESLEDFLKNHMPARVRPPGVTSTYTNYGMALAGYIVQLVSGQDYASYLEDHIFHPLQMDHSTAREPLGAGNPLSISSELEPLLATGYIKGPDGKPQAQPFDLVGAVGPAGVISSSALDMARYMMARLDDDRYEGGRLVSAETSERMHHRLYDDRPGAVDMAYALGDDVVEGYQWRWHNGGTTTFLSDMTMYPELQLGIFISTNSTDGGSEVSGQLPKLIFKRYFSPRAEFKAASPPADFAQRGQKYAGQFKMSRTSYTQLEKIAALPSVSTFTVDADGYLLQAFLGQTIKWAEVGPGKFENTSEKLSGYAGTRYLYFYENDQGEAVRATLPLSDLVRISWWESPTCLYIGFGVALLLSFTILLGAWRRSGMKVQTKGGAGVWAGRLATLAATSVLVTVICVGATAASVASNPLALLFNWPPAPLRFGLCLILLIIALTLGMLWFLPRIWARSSWGWLRKTHYTLFALACVFLLFMCLEWNMIGFKYF